MPSLLAQLVVKLGNLAKETVVGPDVSVPSNLREGLDGRHVAAEHEEGQHARRRPRHSHQAVDEHLPAALEGTVCTKIVKKIGPRLYEQSEDVRMWN